MQNNDEDIKIFHPGKKDVNSELLELAEICETFRRNGNTNKAAVLGDICADLTPETILPEKVKALSNNEIIQLRSLIVFACQIAFHKYLPHSVLASQSVNSMYESISKNSRGFFCNISDGSAFSFYSLALCKPNGGVKEIGKSYAMLCDRDDNPDLMATAVEAFELIDEFVFNKIEFLRFEF